MSLPAYDDFNRGNGALGSNWTSSVGSDLAISSQEVTGASGADSSMYWNADTPDADQYVQIVLKDFDLGSFSGPACRANGSDWVFLDMASGDEFWDLEWYNGGAWTVIGSSYDTAPTYDDIAKIEAEGTAFRGYVNGTQRCSGSNASAPSSGYGGVYCYSNVVRVDDFEVGNLGAAAQGLTTTLYSDTDSFGSHTVTPGSVTLTATLFSDTDSFGSHTISSSAELTTTLYSDTDSFGSPTVIPGSVTLTTTSYSDTDSFGSHIVEAGAVTITTTLYQDSDSYGADYIDILLDIHPDSDVSISGWTNELGSSVNIYQSIDEVIPNDSDYAIVNPTASPISGKWGLSTFDPNLSRAHLVRYRFRKQYSGTVNLTVRLLQDTTTIASWIHSDISSSWTSVQKELSGVQADNITDYSILRLEFEVVTV